MMVDFAGATTAARRDAGTARVTFALMVQVCGLFVQRSEHRLEVCVDGGQRARCLPGRLDVLRH